MAKNASLRKADKEKNDEFYTRIEDIENELKHYKDHFKGKTIFCNCDDPEWSNFWRYFNLNFDHLGIKRLLATHYEDSKQSYMLEMWRDENGVHSDIRTLKQNGDFRSPECIELLKEADIVVTNPPFSIAREFYIPQLFEYKKQFLIIGDLNWITYKHIFPLLKDNNMWLGYNTVKQFAQPDGTMKKFGNKLWFTNLDIKKRHEEIILYKHYNDEEYQTFDELPNIINIDKTTDIPLDYDGLMAVPISFLDKYNPDQFEIIDALNRYTVLDYWGINEDVKKRHSHCCNINGKAKYYRIVIRRKQ